MRRATVNLTVNNLTDHPYDALTSRAHANRRSIASGTTVLLKRALGQCAPPEEDLPHRAKRLRERPSSHLSEATYQKAVRGGRA